jgi:hypothetical protein
MIITGSPDPRAYTQGKTSPAELVIVSGISMPKYKIAVCGQKANEKIDPKKNEL